MNDSVPLLCWDLFIESYKRKMSLLESLQSLNQLAARKKWKIEWDFEKELLVRQKTILVTDTKQVIRYASSNLSQMNGYYPLEVVGKTPKMFQGEGTEAHVRSAIRDALVQRRPFKGSIVNYRKDGSAYDCLVEEYPVWASNGQLVNFIAFEQVA